MKHIVPVILALVILALPACKQDGNQQTNNTAPAASFANPDLLGGHWIAMDFCARAAQYGSVLGSMNNGHIPYAYAMTFLPNKLDSVLCFNGVEQWSLPVKYNADTIELVNARAGKSVFLMYNSSGDKSITMFDGTGARTQTDRFIKSKANARNGYLAFTTALNHNLFNGVFTPVGKGGKQSVQFTPGGFITGLGEYDRYDICTAGDCFVAGSDIDIFTLSNSKKENSGKICGFRYSAQNDTLFIYSMVDTNPNEKGVYKIANKMYTFLRKKTD